MVPPESRIEAAGSGGIVHGIGRLRHGMTLFGRELAPSVLDEENLDPFVRICNPKDEIQTSKGVSQGMEREFFCRMRSLYEPSERTKRMERAIRSAE
jgi:hypothetical protein